MDLSLISVEIAVALVAVAVVAALIVRLIAVPYTVALVVLDEAHLVGRRAPRVGGGCPR